MPRSGKRVYEGNNDTPLLLYARPTSADLEALCRVSTERGNLIPPVAQATLWHEISRLGISISLTTFIPITACSSARNDGVPGSLPSFQQVTIDTSAPALSSFRPQRSGVEKSHAPMVLGALTQVPCSPIHWYLFPNDLPGKLVKIGLFKL